MLFCCNSISNNIHELWNNYFPQAKKNIVILKFPLNCMNYTPFSYTNNESEALSYHVTNLFGLNNSFSPSQKEIKEKSLFGQFIFLFNLQYSICKVRKWIILTLLAVLLRLPRKRKQHNFQNTWNIIYRMLNPM